MNPRTQIEIDARKREQALSSPGPKKSYAWLWSFPVGAAMIWGFSLIPPRDPCEDMFGAQDMAEQYVQGKLKAPSTAVFPGKDATGVTIVKIEACKFRAVGYVDAENSFGAMIRTAYTVELEPGKKKDEWRLSNLQMSDPN